MTAQEYYDRFSSILWEQRIIGWLQAVVLVLLAAALTKYLFFR